VRWTLEKQTTLIDDLLECQRELELQRSIEVIVKEGDCVGLKWTDPQTPPTGFGMKFGPGTISNLTVEKP
jgi:hypothetical protein